MVRLALLDAELHERRITLDGIEVVVEDVKSCVALVGFDQLLAVDPEVLEVRPVALLPQVEVRAPFFEVVPSREADHASRDRVVLLNRVPATDANRESPSLHRFSLCAAETSELLRGLLLDRLQALTIQLLRSALELLDASTPAEAPALANA